MTTPTQISRHQGAIGMAAIVLFITANGISPTQAATPPPLANEPTAHITGKVVDESGVSVANIRLVAFGKARFGLGPSGCILVEEARPCATNQSDTAGRFDLGVSGGDWSIGLNSEDAQQQDLFDTGLGFYLFHGDTTNVTYVVRRANAHVSGQVRDNTDLIITNIPLDIKEWNQGFSRRILTDTNGQFEVNLVGGTWSLILDSSNALQRGLFPTNLVFSLTNGAQTNINYTVQKANAYLSGQVVDEQDVPLGQTGVRVQRVTMDDYGGIAEISDGPTTITDTAGRFDLAVIGGSWFLSLDPLKAQTNNLFPTNLLISVTNGESQTNIIYVVQKANVHLSGQVVDQASNAVPGILLNVGNMPDPNSPNPFYPYSRSVRTDSNGFFTVELIGGKWSLWLDSSEAQAQRLFYRDLNVTLTNGQAMTNIMYAVRRATAHISGCLSNRLGQPLADIQVFARSLSENYDPLRTWTDDAGHYELDVFDGPWEVGISSACQLSSLGYECPTNQQVMVANDNPIVNFIVWPKSRLVVLSFSATEGARIRLTGTPGRSYEIQTLTNPTHLYDWYWPWPSLLITNVGTSGFVEIVDTNALAAPSRFYRAAVQ